MYATPPLAALRAHLYAPCERPTEMTWVGAPPAAAYARQVFRRARTVSGDLGDSVGS